MKSLILICFSLLTWPGEYNREERIQYVMVIFLLISTIILIIQVIPTICDNQRKKRNTGKKHQQ
ncbi:MAG: hypothetical protein LUG51_17800 [Tannerellaceae bacterium]|nr:hypothetical protein [Tannerellaceae bacterium]